MAARGITLNSITLLFVSRLLSSAGFEQLLQLQQGCYLIYIISRDSRDRLIKNLFDRTSEFRNHYKITRSGVARFYCPSWFVWLFVCLFVVPSRTFHSWKSHHCRWSAANFDLCLALMAIEQWGFFSVPHLLWQGASVYNGRLRGPVTNTFCWAFSSGAVTTCLHDLGLSWLIFEHPTFRLRGERSSPVRHRRNPPPFFLHLLFN